MEYQNKGEQKKMKVKMLSFHDKYDFEINEEIDKFIEENVEKLIDIKITVNELLKQSLGNGYSNSYTFYKTILIAYEEKEKEEEVK